MGKNGKVMMTKINQTLTLDRDSSKQLRLADLVSTRSDWIGIGILLISVTVVFAIPAILNHPSISADNLIQNFPLRVLSGQQIAHGHLPLWNPLSFSGTPLLGSMNAGSLFPLTIPFAFLPGVLVWTINLMACYWAAAIGVFLVARYFGIDAYGSLLAGAVFAFMGAQWGQMVHLGVIQGQGLLPWALLAMVMIGDRIRAPRSLRERSMLRNVMWPTLGLSVVTGLVMLSGEPRAIADLEMLVFLVGVYGAFIAKGLRGWRSVWTLGAYGLALIWGALLGAVQLLPGYAFIGISQRSVENYDFFRSGSIALHHVVLLGIPLFFGTNGVLGQDRFFSDYNLPEVTGYIGLVGLVAIAAGVLQVVRRGSRSAPRHLWLLVGMAIAGLLLATASVTPLGHLFYAIPLWGKTRLQSRSIVFFDLAGALLLGWFVQGFIEGKRELISMTGWRQWASLSPLFAVLASLIVVLAAPARVLAHLDVPPALVFHGSLLRGLFLCNLALVVAALVVLIRGRRSSSRHRAIAISSLVVVDLLFFALFAATGLTSGNSQVTPSKTYAASILGTHGRFAIVDNPGANIDQVVALGLPNLNVFTQLPSVQGYGSLIASQYNSVTQDHTQQTLGACEFASGNFRDLRLATMYIGSEQLLMRFWPSNGIPAPAAPLCVGTPSPTIRGARVFYFGSPITMANVSLVISNAAGVQASDVHISLRTTVGRDGVVGPWFSPAQKAQITSSGVSVDLPTQPAAVEMRVSLGGVSGPRVEIADSSQITGTGGGNHWVLGGPMQDVMDASDWNLTRMVTGGGIFKAPFVKPFAWLSSGRVLASSMSNYGQEQATVKVDHTSTLYLSESALPGWRATITPLSGGQSRDAVIGSSKGIQTISIPNGTWKVRLWYRAPHLTVGLAASGLGFLALVLAFGFLAWDRRRRASSRN